MFSLDNKCPSCGRIGVESLMLAKNQCREVTLVAFCDFCFFRAPVIRLCARVSYALYSSTVFDGGESLLAEPCGLILNFASLVPTSGPVAATVEGRLRSLFNFIEDGDATPIGNIDDTVFGKLIWFAGMYGHRFITLDLLRSLTERSAGPVGNGEHISGESL